MAYGSSFNFRVSSFSNLEQMYKETKPINERNGGTSKDIRPLGSRTQKHARVEKIDDDTYACVFYDTRCVTYYRNGKVEFRHNGYATQSTRGFIDVCAPWGWGASLIQSMIHIYARHTNQYYIMGNEPLIFINIDDPTAEVINAVTPTKRKVNREQSKEARAKFQPFLNFARGVMGVLNLDVPKIDSMTWWEIRTLREEFISDPSSVTEDRYLDILAALIAQTYRGQTYTQIKRQLHAAGTVYDRVELPIGSCQKR